VIGEVDKARQIEKKKRKKGFYDKVHDWRHLEAAKRRTIHDLKRRPRATCSTPSGAGQRKGGKGSSVAQGGQPQANEGLKIWQVESSAIKDGSNWETSSGKPKSLWSLSKSIGGQLPFDGDGGPVNAKAKVNALDLGSSTQIKSEGSA